MTLKNAYSTRPIDINQGDEFCFVIKLLVTRKENGQPFYRIYRCPFEGFEAPQGDEIDTEYENEITGTFFPVISWADGIYDL